MATNFIENRNIRIFISSTFKDLQEERDYLVKVTFPQMRRLAQERNVYVTLIDLRWGITEEETKSGEVLRICLKEIEKSIPFFIGIVGNRYGWIPNTKEISTAIINKIPKLQSYLDKKLSITEIEFLYGALDRKEKTNASFYIKEVSTKDKEYNKKLEQLKTKVYNNKYYKTYKFDSSITLSNQVINNFIEILNQYFPLVNTDRNRTKYIQQAYINELCQCYIENEKLYKIVDVWCATNESVLVIVGNNGMGKSSFVANWCNTQIHKKKDISVIKYFIGIGKSTNSIVILNKIICKELCNIYKLQETDSIQTIFSKISNIKEKTVVCIDGIDMLENQQREKMLSWLPNPPSNIKFLLTTTESDETVDAAKNRNFYIANMPTLNKTEKSCFIKSYLNKFAKSLTAEQLNLFLKSPISHNTLVLKTMLDEAVYFGDYENINNWICTLTKKNNITEFFQTIVLRYESTYGKELTKEILGIIALSRNGLAEEDICAIGNIRQVDFYLLINALNHLLINLNGRLNFAHPNIKSAITKLYFYNFSKQEEIRGKFINFYSNKFNKDDLASIEECQYELPYQLFMSQKHEQLHEYLLNLKVFAFLSKNDNFMLVKYWQFLNSKDSYSFLDYIPILDKESQCVKGELCISLCDFLLKNRIDTKSLLPLAEKAEENIYCSFDVDMTYNILGSVYHYLGKYSEALKWQKKAFKIAESQRQKSDTEYLRIVNDIGIIYHDMRDFKNSIIWKEKALDIIDKNSDDAVQILYNTGCSYRESGNLEKAIIIFRSIEQKFIELYGKKSYETFLLYNELGCSFGQKKDFKKAFYYLFESKNIILNIYTKDHLFMGTLFHNISNTYKIKGDSDMELKYELDSLHIYEKNSEKSAIIKSLENVASIYLRNQQFKEALNAYSKLEKMYKNNYGFYNEFTADVYIKIGEIYSELKEHENAIENYENACKILSNIQVSGISKMINCLIRIGEEFYDLKSYDYAIKSLKYVITLLEHSGQENSYNYVYTIYRMGMAFYNSGDYESALDYFAYALKFQEEQNETPYIFGLCRYYASAILWIKKEYDASISNAFSAIELFDQNGNKKEAQQVLDYIIPKIKKYKPNLLKS